MKLHTPLVAASHCKSSVPLLTAFLVTALTTAATALTPIEIPVVNSGFENPNVGSGVGGLRSWQQLPGTGIFVEGHNTAGLRNGEFERNQHTPLFTKLATFTKTWESAGNPTRPMTYD